MPEAAKRTFRIVERSGPGMRAIFRRELDAGCDLIVLSGFEGPVLPGALVNPHVVPQGPRSLRLESEGRAFDLTARAVDTIEVRPGLYAGLHRAFALGAGERLAARMLLALLRLPGGASLLRRWHAGRGA